LGMVSRIEDWLRTAFSQNLCFLEAVLYIGVGILLAAASASSLFEAALALWRGIISHSLASSVLQSLDQLLLVLMLVEILHTVRISIQSQSLSMEPFLIVGLIASIRRSLVITMQAAKMTEGGPGSEYQMAFQNSMIELGVLAGLVLVFVASIYVLRRLSRNGEAIQGQDRPWII
jgi:uncharacterized membrane protein (DUF373 family)